MFNEFDNAKLLLLERFTSGWNANLNLNLFATILNELFFVQRKACHTILWTSDENASSVRLEFQIER